MKFFEALSFIVVATCMLSMIGYVFAIGIDMFTLQEVGTENVPCVDEYNNEFEDEMCIHEKTCSWLGLVGDVKCGDIGK